MKSNTIYAFWHLPKTGGTTLTSHLFKHYQSDKLITPMLNDYERDKHKEHGDIYWLDLDLEQQLKAKIISGHDVNPDALSMIQPYCDLCYFTIIREPYSKLISAYNYFVDRLQKDKSTKVNFNAYLLERHKGLGTSAQFLIRFCGWNLRKINEYIEANGYVALLTYIVDKFKKFTFIADQANYDDDVSVICEKMLGISPPISNHFVAGIDIKKTLTIEDISTDYVDKYLPIEKELYNRPSDIRHMQLEKFN